jgi:hypothetical protein
MQILFHARSIHAVTPNVWVHLNFQIAKEKLGPNQYVVFLFFVFLIAEIKAACHICGRKKIEDNDVESTCCLHVNVGLKKPLATRWR